MPIDSIQTTVLLRSEQTAGEVSAIENVLPPRFGGPPLHHHDFDETFYVLDGELELEVAGRRVTACTGEVAFAPRGVVHTLANLSDAPARYLLVCTPAGLERYFDRIAADQAGAEPAPEGLKPYPETIVVGPPLSAER
jgi:quercetin dioxygenase-like cupin family protein